MSNTEELDMEIGCLVELREGFEKVYPLSFPGAQAKVADYSIDPEGFERVKVAWDKKHWRYNGERDNWTYASHFRVIAPAPDAVAPKEEPVEETPSRFQSAKEGDGTIDPNKGILRYLNNKRAKRETNKVDQFANMLQMAFKYAQDGTGVYLFTMSPRDDGRLVPMLFAGSLDDETDQILKQAVLELASQIINEMEDDDE